MTYIHKSLAESQMGFVDHVKIPFELLSKELQEKYNFNPASADAYRKMLADNAEAWRKIQEENEKIAAQKAERQKEELDLEIKIRTLQALEAQAAAQQRQADAQERAAGAQESQSLSQQQINSQLEDLNWQLMRLRQQNRGY